MNPFHLLSEDHRQLLALANQLTGGAGEPSGTVEARQRLAQRLVILGSVHQAVEEQHLWPLVRQRLDGGDALATAGLQQEIGARKLLHELNHVHAGNSHFDTLVFTVASTIRDHMTYEESQIWPKLQLACAGDELDRVGDAMDGARASAPTRPHPHLPTDGRLLQAVSPLLGTVDRAYDRVTGRGR